MAYTRHLCVRKDLTAMLDMNKDGKFDAGDVNIGYGKVLKVLQNNTVGLSGGFAGGFLLGVRSPSPFWL